MALRAAANSVFGVLIFVILAMATGLISANVRKLADKYGWDNVLVHGTDKLRWERVRTLWWLWSIFGLSGGITLALWLTPLAVGLSNRADGNGMEITSLQSQLNAKNNEITSLKSALNTETKNLKNAEQAIKSSTPLTPTSPPARKRAFS